MTNSEILYILKYSVTLPCLVCIIPLVNRVLKQHRIIHSYWNPPECNSSNLTFPFIGLSGNRTHFISVLSRFFSFLPKQLFVTPTHFTNASDTYWWCLRKRSSIHLVFFFFSLSLPLAWDNSQVFAVRHVLCTCVCVYVCPTHALSSEGIHYNPWTLCRCCHT